MDLKLRDAVVLITGASRGLGREFAVAFAEEGAHVAIYARDSVKLGETAAAVRARGVECLALQADLLDGAMCQSVVDETAARFGRLDVLINNASTSVDSTPKSIEVATDNQVMARIHGKTLVAIRSSRAALPHMRKSGCGRIVCIGGTAARSIFRPGDMPSEGSGLAQGLGNSALANFTKYLSEEAAPDGIAVNIIHPHLTRTDRHSQRVARQAVRRQREASRRINRRAIPDRAGAGIKRRHSARAVAGFAAVGCHDRTGDRGRWGRFARCELLTVRSGPRCACL